MVLWCSIKLEINRMNLNKIMSTYIINVSKIKTNMQFKKNIIHNCDKYSHINIYSISCCVFSYSYRNFDSARSNWVSTTDYVMYIYLFYNKRKFKCLVVSSFLIPHIFILYFCFLNSWHIFIPMYQLIYLKIDLHKIQ